MYSLSQLTRAIQSPNLALRELNRLYHQRLIRDYNEDGLSIFDEDWDNLLILDACRYDMFKDQSNLPGKLNARISRGSATIEFLRANFHQRELYDTVYVTANPQLYRKRSQFDTHFHSVKNIWQENWDNDHLTVLPETTTNYARRYADEYPNKRLIVHYLQPHYPFIGADENYNMDVGDELLNPNEDACWDQIMTGEFSDIDVDQVWAAYRDNLNKVLPHVEKLLHNLPGKSVVTSDHGNMIGERAWPIPIKEWGHPHGIYTKELVKVPWLIFENGVQKDVISDPPDTDDNDIADGIVEERLSNLGYK